MRQILYVSDSLIATDERALDRVMVQSRTNNALEGTTGLLWTDGARFAQVLEGDDAVLTALLARLRTDKRHTTLQIVADGTISERQYGDWSMMRPATDKLAALYERRIVEHLHQLTDASSVLFRTIIAGSAPAIST